MKFEFKDPESGAVLYLEVLETFEHYYTKKKIYRCRVHDRVGLSNDWCFDENEFNEILEKRIKKPVGYATFKNGCKVEIFSTGFSADSMLEFSTSMFKYRIKPCVADLSLDQSPKFERWNPDTGVWISSSGIDRIELFGSKEEKEK